MFGFFTMPMPSADDFAAMIGDSIETLYVNEIELVYKAYYSPIVNSAAAF
jgi:hypothetical protein